MTPRIVWAGTDTPADLTPAQQTAVVTAARRFDLTREPIAVHAGPDCVMLRATAHLWLGIERDGYTHS